jgi:DNA-binding beta-propeller fold protein YncE
MPSDLPPSPQRQTAPVSHVARARGKTSLVGVMLAVLAATFILSRPGGEEAAAATLKAGDILVTDRGSTIYKIDPATGAQTVVTSFGVLDNLFGITIDANGQILVTSGFVRVAGSPAGVGRVDPETGAQTIVTTSGLLSAPLGIAIDADGQILVVDSNLGGVVRVDPATGAQTLVTTGGFLGPLSGITVVSKKKK